jgi:hypothetical protein
LAAETWALSVAANEGAFAGEKQDAAVAVRHHRLDERA